MNTRLPRLALLAGAFLIWAVGATVQRQFTATASTSQDAKAVMQKVCGSCHGVDRVTSSRRSRAQWEEVTNKMISMGAKGSDEEIATIINYLATNFSREAVEPTGGRPKGRHPGVLGAGSDDQQTVDNVAADRGRKTWAMECINCHGATARGTDKGSNLVRSDMAWSDRYGSDFYPLLQKGHPMQSGAASTSLSKTQVEDLSHFIHQQLYETLRGSTLMDVKNILTGNVQEGAAFFNGAGKCTTCHSATGDLAGYGGTATPVNIQQRFMFPRLRKQKVTITVTPANGAAMTGTPAHIDDFDVALRDEQGAYHSWKRSTSLKVTQNDPLKAHHELLDKITDKNMHDIVAYLESLK